MKSNSYFLILFLALLAGCNSPDAWDIFKSTGHTKTEIRKLASFDAISISEDIEFQVVVQDTVSKIVLSAGKNLIPKISSSVQNNTLTIKDNNRFDFVRSNSRTIKICIYTYKLRLLNATTGKNFYIFSSTPSDSMRLMLTQCSGDIFAIINAKKLKVRQRESTSKIVVTGITDSLDYRCGLSFGPVDLSALNTSYAKVLQDGPNDLSISVRDSLNVTIKGIGNVNYSGYPLIKSKVTGKGRLVKM